MFNYEVKFLTSDETQNLKNSDFRSYKYETKKKVEESVFDTGKRNFCERRGGHWRAPRPSQIRQLESKLSDRSVVFCDWTTEAYVTIVFSTGAIAYLTLKPDTLDVTQILFDRYCVGKLSGQLITGVVLCKSHLLFTHSDRISTLVSFGKNTNENVPYRISDRDPHFQSVEIGGGARRAEKKLSWCENSTGVIVLVWGTATAEPAPWSPTLEDFANLHIYKIHGQQVNLTAYHQLENETLSAELSHKVDNIVHIIEQIASHKNSISLDWLQYELPATEDRVAKLSCLHVSATHVALPAPVRVTRRSPCDTRLLTACIDGSLHVVHHAAGLTHSTKAGFIATDVRWAGELVVAAEEGGRLQCFDRALSLLHHHTKCIDLTTYLRDARRFQLLASMSTRGGPLLLASFTGGPLTLLRISHPRLLTAWIRVGRTSNAVALLRALDWETDGMEGLWAVNRLVCDSIRARLQGAAGEASAQAALGAFLAPGSPHGPLALRLAPPLHDLARKFFHHLLRRGRVEKALSLAVDLSAADLFADARWAAQRRGLGALHREAAALAAHHAKVPPNRPGSECSDSCSQCSTESYSGSDETSPSPEAAKTKPPPLPRVSIMNPTIMPVPISQSEPMSTNSIRPLHQYLERDNTIWHTVVRDDTHITRNTSDHIKPILSSNARWNSVDNVLLNYKQGSKHGLLPISEGPPKSAHSVVDVDEERTAVHYRHLYQTELREELPNTLYRYHSSNYRPSTVNERSFRHDLDVPERLANRSGEKNKVKFSDTVTVSVMPEACPSPAAELAASLPLSPPHAYLAAFAPHAPLAPLAPSPAGTAAARDCVQV